MERVFTDATPPSPQHRVRCRHVKKKHASCVRYEVSSFAKNPNVQQHPSASDFRPDNQDFQSRYDLAIVPFHIARQRHGSKRGEQKTCKVVLLASTLHSHIDRAHAGGQLVLCTTTLPPSPPSTLGAAAVSSLTWDEGERARAPAFSTSVSSSLTPVVVCSFPSSGSTRPSDPRLTASPPGKDSCAGCGC